MGSQERPEDELVGALNFVMGSRRFIDDTPTGVILRNAEGKVIDCNDTALAILNSTREELLVHYVVDPIWGMVNEDGSAVEVDDVPSIQALRSGEPITGVVMGTGDQHQARRWILVNSSAAPLEDGTVGAVSVFVDVTPRIKSRRRLQLLTQVNRVVMSVTDERTCLQLVCDALVEHGPYSLAWVGMTADDGRGGVDIEMSSGLTDYLYEGMVSWWGNEESGLGPTGRALRTGETQVTNDVASDAAFELWRDRATEFGLNSSVAIPLNYGGHAAVLNVYDRSHFTFDEETVASLEDLVQEVEFGLAHLRSVNKTEWALRDASVTLDALRFAEHELSQSEQRFRLAFEGNMAPMLFTDLEDQVFAVNDAFCQMLGRTKDEILEHHWPPFTHPEDLDLTDETHRQLLSGEVDQLRYMKRYLHRDGHVVAVEISRYAARDDDGRMLYTVISARDVTEERALADQLSHQALYDPLTGLANRVLFQDRLAQAIGRADRIGGVSAVLYVDLDDFKGVNDARGHLVGDQLLVGVARRFEMVTRSADTLCRFSGDEFLVLAEGLDSAAEAEDVAQRVLDVLAEPFTIDGAQFEQNASVGIVVWDDSSTSVEDVIQSADSAVYEAKVRGKGRFVVFTPNIHQEAVSRFSLTQELRQALRAGELAMHYQPIVNLATTEIVGFEALMRWHHAERGDVPPTVFIPLAEQSDLILELGAFALREAAKTATSWGSTTQNTPDPYVTVNLSARQFRDPGLVPMIERELTQSGLVASRLIIEITESVTLYDVGETLNVMENLNRLGVRIALDDFGTGYSSLSYLVRLDPKIVKIDRYFISPSFESDDNEALLETIVTLGNKLRVTMVAEGIETRAQLDLLRGLGCDSGQGFLFSPAVPASEVGAMLLSGADGWR